MVTLRLSKHSLGGNDGCNHFGTFHLNDESPPVVASIIHASESSAEGELYTHDFLSSQRFCPGISQQGDEFLSALKAGKGYRIQNNRLEILDRNGKVTLVLVREPPFIGHQPDLAGTQWEKETNGTTIFLAFIDNKVVAGLGKCLDYIGRHFASDKRLLIDVSPLGKSIECWNDPIDSVWHVERYAVSGEEGSSRLMLGTRLGEALTLNELPSIPPNSPQVIWSLKFIVDLPTDDLGYYNEEPVIPGSTVTVSLHDNQIAGSSGCNAYQAPLEIEGTTIEIGAVSAEELVCEDLENPSDLMDQESRFLDLLPQVTRGVTIADRLFLSTPTGIYLIFEAQ